MPPITPADEAIRSAGIKTLFADLVEACNDRLDSVGRDAYAAFFPAVIWRIVEQHQELKARLAAYGIHSRNDLYARYGQQRMNSSAPDGLLPAKIQRVVILSRVTIGADVLLSTICCQRVHEAFPEAEIMLIGDKKLQGLLGGLPKVSVVPIRYTRRGPLGERLGAWLQLADLVDDLQPDLLISPDSRLDQLGIMPLVSHDKQYLLWENTQKEGGDALSLGALFDQWLRQVFPAKIPKLYAATFGL